MSTEKEATLLLKIKDFASSVMDRFRITLGDVINIVKSLGNAMLAPIEAWREAELANNKLTTSMVQQGVFTTALRDKYLNMAAALQKTTLFGDDATVSAIGQIQAYAKQNEVTEGLIKATMDFATATGMDLNSAAELVGKSIGTSTNALGRYGVQLDTSASTSEKMTAITKTLTDRFGGQAEAAAAGLGSIEQMKNLFGDLLEVIGQQLAPAVTFLVQQMKDMLTSFQENEFAVSALRNVIEVTTQTLQGLWNIGAAIVNLFSQGLTDAIMTVEALVSGDFSRAWERAKQGVVNARNGMAAEAQNMVADYQAINQRFQAENEIQAAKDELLLKQSEANKARIRQEAAAAETLRRTEDAVTKMEEELFNDQMELERIGAKQEDLIAIEMRGLDRRIANEENFSKKMELLRQKQSLIHEQQALKRAAVSAEETKMQAEEEKKRTKQQLDENKLRESDQRSTFATMASLSSDNNKTLATIGKAAALTQLAIDGPVAVTKALSAFPPPFNFAAAGAVSAALAVQATRLAGVRLAEGGIVKATPGGVPAIIGEGGRDEAVIPLDRAGSFGNVNVHFHGPIMGDQSHAREFALALDRELLKLRRSNESVAFDTGII